MADWMKILLSLAFVGLVLWLIFDDKAKPASKSNGKNRKPSDSPGFAVEYSDSGKPLPGGEPVKFQTAG